MKRILLAIVAAAAFATTVGVLPATTSTAEARPWIRAGVAVRPYYRGYYRPYYGYRSYRSYYRPYYGYGYGYGYAPYYSGYYSW